VTPLEIAVRMAAPFLIERGVDPSEDGLGPALVMRLLLELPEERGYFRPLANQPEMAAALWSTMRELRMAGLRASDLKPEHFSSAAKHAELTALLGAYERFLSDCARADFPTVFEEALRHRDWCPIQDADCWTELPDVVWPPIQRRLLDAMPGERIEPVALALPGATLPRRLKEARTARQEPAAAAPLAFLMAPELAPPGDRSALSLFHAGGCEAEVETVVRRILASGRTLDQVEIVCASPHYSALVWEKAMRYEWPVTLAQGLPAALTRPGRALLSLVDWIEDDFAAGRLRRLFESGDVRLPEHVPMSAGRAARLLIRAQAA
jgi:hypothetical protein